MTDREIFKRNLSALIHESKARQIDIAKYAEVSFQAVSSWVTGRAYPRADAMQKLCTFFGVKMSALTEEQKETDEDHLLLVFRSLSDKGKGKLLERADELRKLYPKRSKDNG